MRTIGVVTVGRSDYGIYLPLLRKIVSDAELNLYLIVAGMHLAPEFGLSARLIENDGFPIAERVEMLLASDSPEGIAKSMGLGTLGFAQVFARQRPDLLVVLGDRFEMHAAAVAALPFRIPVAHIHGGELTFGAIDDALRHCLTKLSHLHFVATEEYARRTRQLGEESWRVIVSGSPSLDNLLGMKYLSKNELERQFGLNLDKPPALVTFHSTTLEIEHTPWQVDELLAALESLKVPIVLTKSNADTNGRIINLKIEQFVRRHSAAYVLDNMGTQAYFSLMRLASLMVGNSSSGLIEAPSFQLPVVNIGTRQQGRCRAANVIDVGYERAQIMAGIRKALEPSFRNSLCALVNPFGCGKASEVIVQQLKDIPLDDRLIRKRFADIH